MKDNERSITYKYLLKRGMISFLFIGILFSIIQDKEILAYFLKSETLIQIMLFVILGGLLSSWINYRLLKRLERRKSENSG